jgi:hypothetical protein
MTPLTVLACVVGYLAVGVLVAIVGGVTGFCEEPDHYAHVIFLFPLAIIFGVVVVAFSSVHWLVFALARMAERGADIARYALAARKPPTEDEL